MAAEKVLVLNATGKVGRNVCRALNEADFEVFGTSRSPQNKLSQQGVQAVVCNYTVRADLDRALVQSGAKKIFVITDFFAAAKSSSTVEFEQGKAAIDAARLDPHHTATQRSTPKMRNSLILWATVMPLPM